MSDIYRKAALDKLSSPEQLDKMIKIISPSFWIAAIGGGGIILVALIWSIFGRLPENVSANGIFMGEISGDYYVYNNNIILPVSSAANELRETYLVLNDKIDIVSNPILTDSTVE